MLYIHHAVAKGAVVIAIQLKPVDNKLFTLRMEIKAVYIGTVGAPLIHCYNVVQHSGITFDMAGCIPLMIFE